MKLRHFKPLMCSAAILVLPALAMAEKNPTGLSSDTGSAPGLTRDGSSAAAGAASGTGAYISGGSFQGGQQAGQQQGDFNGGIMVHDGSAYIIHRLQSEMSLPDGSKVKPDGTITGKDGAERKVGDDQLLTLDGRVLAAPFGPQESTLSDASGLGADLPPKFGTDPTRATEPNRQSSESESDLGSLPPGRGTGEGYSSPVPGQTSPGSVQADQPGINTSTDPSGISSPGTESSGLDTKSQQGGKSVAPGSGLGGESSASGASGSTQTFPSTATEASGTGAAIGLERDKSLLSPGPTRLDQDGTPHTGSTFEKGTNLDSTPGSFGATVEPFSSPSTGLGASEPSVGTAPAIGIEPSSPIPSSPGATDPGNSGINTDPTRDF